MNGALLYVHGKGGSAAESERYRAVCPEYAVYGIEFEDFTPWGAMEPLRCEFDRLLAQYGRVTLLANSIGAYFSMLALGDRPVEKAMLISPVVDMEGLICDMMRWAGVTEAELRDRRVIPVPFGDDLSWDYLCWVRAHPIAWQAPTEILYAERDNLTPRATVERFARTHGAGLTVMPDGEHWFHTPPQLAFLDEWLRRTL